MPVWRFWNNDTGTHFYTAAEAERDIVATNLPNMRYEGVGFDDPNGTNTTVWRFRRLDTGAHFYTASLAERDEVIARMPGVYAFEGAGFSASTVQTASATQAVYRFWNRDTGAHFYTANEVERASVVANMPNMRFEGIAYYMAPPPSQPDRTGSLDEAWYLSAYPDVADSVAAGFTTAAKHWQEFGQREGRLPQNLASLAGNDTVGSKYSAPKNGDRLNGGAGNDSLVGGSGNDSLFGETGNDTLVGYQYDYLNGGAGDDTYILYSSGATIQEGTSGGTDTVVLSNDVVNFSIPDNVEIVRYSRFTRDYPANNIIVVGGSGGKAILSDTAVEITMSSLYQRQAIIYGGWGDNYIQATGLISTGGGNDIIDTRYWTYGRTHSTVNGSSSDTVYAGDGNDTVYISSGSDSISGGGGSDIFVLSMPSGPPSTFGLDTSLIGTTTITDFQPGIDSLRFAGTTLSPQQIADRFTASPVNIPGASSVLTATFTGADFADPYATRTNMEIRLSGLTPGQLTAGMIAIA